MGFVVKNTTKCGLLDLLCPHSCRGCGRLGSILCECCKNYTIQQIQPICPICKNPIVIPPKNVQNSPEPTPVKCPDCSLPFDVFWTIGYRQGALKKLIEEFKYQSVRAAGPVLTDLINRVIPSDLGKTKKIILVPLPTIGKHIRARGLDHTLIIAKKLAKLRDWKCTQILSRATDTVQVGAKVSARKTQAAKTYSLSTPIDPTATYILLDDVWTTGSSLLSAAELMRKNGAKRLSAIALSVSPNKPAEQN